MGEDEIARRGCRQGFPHALENGDTEFFLKLQDLAAESWLADVASGGGVAEMFEIGDRDDVAKIAQVHATGISIRSTQPSFAAIQA